MKTAWSLTISPFEPSHLNRLSLFSGSFLALFWISSESFSGLFRTTESDCPTHRLNRLSRRSRKLFEPFERLVFEYNSEFRISVRWHVQRRLCTVSGTVRTAQTGSRINRSHCAPLHLRRSVLCDHTARSYGGSSRSPPDEWRARNAVILNSLI